MVCPKCAGHLRAEAFETCPSQPIIETGLLTCECGEQYPVIKGIPRLLLGNLRQILLKDYADYFSRYGDRLHGSWYQRLPSGEAEAQVKRETADSFGFEWSYFQRMLPVYERNFAWYMEPLGSTNWRGLRVLDAGCGTGRHTYHAAMRGASVVSIDLSRAIDVAARNCAGLPNVDFIQGDLCALPLIGGFDLVYSLGVLHHLPSPEQGFQSISKMLRPGGRLLIYVYWDLEGQPRWRKALLRAVNSFRASTTRMQFDRLRQACLLFSACCYLGLVLPSRILRKWPRSGAVPLAFYRDYPFRVLFNDTFDRFSAPLENRYNAATLGRWFETAHLSDLRMAGGAGWRAAGTAEE
ncbi:MAG: methyltransferase domain-containing protein [Chloroflexota bacterium]